MWASSNVHCGLIHISAHLQEISFSALLSCSRFSWDTRRSIKKNQMANPFFPSVCSWIYVFKGDEGIRLIGKHRKRQQHMMKNVSWKSKLIKCLLSLLLPQVGGVLCLVLNSQLFYDASACPQLKEAQETWLEDQLRRASLAMVQQNPDLVWFRFQATAVRGQWRSPLISLCLGAQTKTHPGVPAYPSLLEEPWWGGRLLQFAKSSQTEPSGPVQDSRYHELT